MPILQIKILFLWSMKISSLYFILNMDNSEKILAAAIEKDLIKIGNRLKFLRKSKGYSSPDLFAYDHGINRSQYGKYEAGRTNITISTLISIIRHFELDLENFFKIETK